MGPVAFDLPGFYIISCTSRAKQQEGSSIRNSSSCCIRNGNSEQGLLLLERDHWRQAVGGTCASVYVCGAIILHSVSQQMVLPKLQFACCFISLLLACLSRLQDPGDVPFEDDSRLRYWLSSSGQIVFHDPHSYHYVWVELYRCVCAGCAGALTPEQRDQTGTPPALRSVCPAATLPSSPPAESTDSPPPWSAAVVCLQSRVATGLLLQPKHAGNNLDQAS